MGEGYYERKAREARETTERNAREAHEGVQQQSRNAHSGVQNNAETSSLGSGQTQKVNPTDLPVASSELAMVSLYTVTTVLGSLAAAALLGKRGRGSN